jgi:hypothetical protein
MRQLEDALRQLAERAEPLPTEVLIARIETELGWAPSAVAESEKPTMVTSQQRDVETPATPPPPQRSRRSPLLAAAVAVVVVLGGVGAAWALGVFGTEAELADSVPPQIATVEAMYDALNAHDADAYASYWAEDAEGWGALMWHGTARAAIGSPEMDKGFEERRVWGAHFALSDCELVNNTVRCLETWDDRVYYDMAGVTFDREVTYLFDDQARITAMFTANTFWDELADIEEAFGPWLISSHPEIAETYLVPGFESAYKWEYILASPENVAGFTGLIEEFIAQSDVYPLAP